MVKRRTVIKHFELMGFRLEHKTNHDVLRHPDGRWTTCGRHAEISNLMFERMKKQVEPRHDAN